jgi:hypothetical protein
MDVVEISINPDKLSDEISEHRHSRDGDSENSDQDDSE